MKIDEITEMWNEDSRLDITNIGNHSADTAKVHHKYYQIYLKEGLKLRKSRYDLAKFRKLKIEYYRGELDLEELRALGWNPQPLKILKQDIPTYLEADEDLIQKQMAIDIQEQKIEYLESILRMITNRGFQLKTMLDFEKFRNGVM